MKKLIFFILITGGLKAQSTSFEKNVKKHISYLASDKLKGRGTSSSEERLAAEYIAGCFKEIGLNSAGNNKCSECPAGDKKYDYLWHFTYKKSTNPHDTGTADAPTKNAMNVAGFLDNGAKETIVIGAHYDHLGLGHDHNSTDPNPEGKIHNGADDNASGTAGVIELARFFATNSKKEKYNFLFICFSGEELGLLGSKKWCEDPTIPPGNINYMINMDMIGRLNESTKKIIVYGVGTSPVWIPIMDSIRSGFDIKRDSSGIGPSDQTSFYLKDIPVLHFFTGQHSDYHKPSDDTKKINFKGESDVLHYIIKIVNATDGLPKMQFLKTRNPDTGKASFKVTMGVMPDYAFEGKGLRIDGVTDNKPAFNAGAKKGDIVIKMGETEVNNIQDYMKGLSEHKKGDTVDVKVLREGKEVILKVTF